MYSKTPLFDTLCCTLFGHCVGLGGCCVYDFDMSPFVFRLAGGGFHYSSEGPYIGVGAVGSSVLPACGLSFTAIPSIDSYTLPFDTLCYSLFGLCDCLG